MIWLSGLALARIAPESREGGADGRCRTYEFDAEEPAMDCVSGLLAQPGDWRELH